MATFGIKKKASRKDKPIKAVLVTPSVDILTGDYMKGDNMREYKMRLSLYDDDNPLKRVELSLGASVIRMPIRFWEQLYEALPEFLDRVNKELEKRKVPATKRGKKL